MIPIMVGHAVRHKTSIARESNKMVGNIMYYSTGVGETTVFFGVGDGLVVGFTVTIGVAVVFGFPVGVMVSASGEATVGNKTIRRADEFFLSSSDTSIRAMIRSVGFIFDSPQLTSPSPSYIRHFVFIS